MVDTEPQQKRTFVQTEYEKGDKFIQKLLDRAKKDGLRKNGKFVLSEANRRIVLESASKVFPPELETVYQPLFEKYGVNGSGFVDQLLALGKQMLSNNGVGENKRQERDFRGYRDGIWHPSNIYKG